MNDRLSSDLASLRIARDESPPSSGWLKRIIIAAVVVGALVAAWIFGYPQLEARVFKPEVEVTQIVTVSPTQAQAKLTSSGYVVPQRVSRVGTKLSGRISKILVRQGDQVEEGQVIAELEGADIHAAIQTAKARVASARASVQTAKAELIEARHQAKRARSLADKGVGSKAEAEDLELRANAIKSRVRAAEAQVRAAQAEVQALDVNVGYLTITAPMSGRVVNKPAEVGELVGQQVANIIELADFDSLVVETDVPEGRLHLVGDKGPAEIVLDAFPTERYRGRVLEIVPKVNRAKATVTVKVSFVDEAEKALPDMAARVIFTSEELDREQMDLPSKVVVPATAIDERGGEKVVWIVEEGVLKMRNVTLGEAVGSGFELPDGQPPPGTTVVREPASTLADGQKVKQVGE